MKNKQKLLSKIVTFKEFNLDLTVDDIKEIEAEKKYYQMVVELRKVREELGLTQENLAKKSNLPRTTISKIESGNRNVTLETLMSLAKGMNRTLTLKFS